MKNLQLPFGVQDYMPQECFNKIKIQEKLAGTFVGHGFQRVETPAIEYYDVYADVLSPSAMHKTFKMTDSDGRLLLLRPDPTLQVCRMAASRLNAEQIRKVYYVSNSYEYMSHTSVVRSREFAQAGVELLGESGVAGDVETIVVAIESLLSVGLTDFMLEIGQIDYFNGLIEEAGMRSPDADTLRELINKKDMLGVELFLKGRNVDERFMSRFLSLPTLFGGAEILSRAREGMIKNSKINRAIDNLEAIISALGAMQFDKYISIDLGLVHGEYYTGLVIKGFSTNLGMPILDGGRYDNLCNAFNKPTPAVGFSIGVKRLLEALEKAGKLSDCKMPDYAYISDGEDWAFEQLYVTDLRQKGFIVEKCFGNDTVALQNHCAKKGIRNAFVIQKKKVTYLEAKSGL